MNRMLRTPEESDSDFVRAERRGREAPGSLRGRRTAAAMREKPVHFETTDCAQGTTLDLSLLPNCPRLSHNSLRGLLPRRLLAPQQTCNQIHVD
jgi:hypothetical protein